MTVRGDRLLTWLDVLVVGPYTVYSSLGIRQRYFRAGLMLVGVSTIALGLYRLRNTGDDDAGAAPPATAELSAVRRRLQLAQALRNIRQ